MTANVHDRLTTSQRLLGKLVVATALVVVVLIAVVAVRGSKDVVFHQRRHHAEQAYVRIAARSLLHALTSEVATRGDDIEITTSWLDDKLGDRTQYFGVAWYVHIAPNWRDAVQQPDNCDTSVPILIIDVERVGERPMTSAGISCDDTLVDSIPQSRASYSSFTLPPASTQSGDER